MVLIFVLFCFFHIIDGKMDAILTVGHDFDERQRDTSVILLKKKNILSNDAGFEWIVTGLTSLCWSALFDFGFEFDVLVQ